MEKTPRALDGGPGTALHVFVSRYRDDIIARTNGKLAARRTPDDPAGDLEHGVPVFLTPNSASRRPWTPNPEA